LGVFGCGYAALGYDVFFDEVKYVCVSVPLVGTAAILNGD
jgi:hypothetical protein